MRSRKPRFVTVSLFAGVLAVLLALSPIGRQLFAAGDDANQQESALRPFLAATGNPTMPPPSSTPVPPGSGYVPPVTYVYLPGAPVLATVLQTVALYSAPSLNAQVTGTLLAGQTWFIKGLDSTGNWALVQITVYTSGWTVRRALNIPQSVPTIANVNGGTVVAFNSGVGRRTFVYVVRPGDTLRILATRYRTSIAALVQMNHIQNPNLIFAGQVLFVP